MPDPFAQVASPVQNADPFAGVASAAPSAASTDWQKQVKPIDLGNGKTSVQRSDGGVWFGPEQGNTGMPGWFSADGKRLGSSPGAPPDKPGFFRKLGYGVEQGLANVGESVLHAVVNRFNDTTEGSIVGDKATQEMAQDLKSDVAQRNANVVKSGAAAKVGKFLGEAAPYAASTLLAPETGLPGLAGRAASAGLGAAPIAYATTPGNDSERLQSAGTATLGGAVGTAVGEKVIAPLTAKGLSWVTNKGADALAGTKLGNVLGISTEVKPQYAGAPQLAADLQSKGIQTTIGDVTGDPAIRAQEGALARNNPKMMAYRLQQNQQASNYADTVVSDLKKSVADAGWQNLSDVQSAAQSGGKRSGAAQALLTAINNSGDDWKEIAQQSGNLRLFVNKLKADALYDKAETLANQFGNVPVPATRHAVDDAVNKLSVNSAGDQGAKAFLGRIQTGLSGGNPSYDPFNLTQGTPVVIRESIPPTELGGDHLGLTQSSKPLVSRYSPGVSQQVDIYGTTTPGTGLPEKSVSIAYSGPKPFEGSQPTFSRVPYQGPSASVQPKQDLSFGGLRNLRSSIQSRIADITSGKVSASSDELPYLQQVISAIEKDLSNFAGSNGAPLRQAYQDASTFYKGAVVPYKDAAFGRALADTDPQKVANLFAGKNAYQQQRFFDLLDPKGQAAVRAGLVEDAISAGEKTQRGVMGQTFSASQAANKLEQLQKNGTMGVAFPGGEDSWAAQGLAKILRTVDRSDNVGFTPPTGVTAQSIGAKVEGNKTVLGTIAQGIDWLQKDRLMKLYTDPQSRVLLQRASDLKIGSPAMQKIIQQLSTLAGSRAGASMVPGGSAIPMLAQGAASSPNQLATVAP